MRPEYVKCVVKERDSRETLCGEPVQFGQWCFVDIAHAMAAADNGDRLLICRGCVKEACRRLRSGAQ